MKIVISILVLVVLISLYIAAYLLNKRVSKPSNCKEINCEGCKLDCYKRSEK